MQAYKHAITSLVVILLLASCATSQQGESEQAIAKAVEAPGDWATTAPAGEVTIEWLNAFNDPLLLQLIEEGKRNNLNLQAAAVNVEKAWINARQAGAVLQPVANLSFAETTVGTAENSNRTNSSNLSAQISWELDIWGRIRAGSRAAAASTKSVEADYKYALHSLGAGIAKAYFIVIEAKIQADVTRKSLAILKETMRIVNVQYDNGLASAQDVSLTRAQLASGEANLLAIEGSKREAIRALELLLGRYPNAELEFPDTLPNLPPRPPAGIPSALLERRPDIIAAERSVAAAFELTSAAKAAALPSLSLTSVVGGTSGGLSNILDPANVAWQLAANIMVPIFDQGNIQARIEIANLEQKQALLAYVKAALDAFSDVETNLDQGNVLVQRQDFLTTAQAEINNAYRIANLRYKEGESDLLDVLTLQQNAIAADSNSVAIKRALLEQRVNLYLALGGDW